MRNGMKALKRTKVNRYARNVAAWRLTMRRTRCVMFLGNGMGDFLRKHQLKTRNAVLDGMG